MFDAYDIRLCQHDEMLQDVPRMLAIQRAIERIDRALDDIHRTLAYVETMHVYTYTLLARVLRAQKKPKRTRKTAPVV
jgi:hypothetical protein